MKDKNNSQKNEVPSSSLSLLNWMQNLSLDVVVGTLAGATFASFLLDTDMPLVWWILLPGVVLFIYSVDHFLDAGSIQGRASTERHRLHQDFRPQILVLIVLLGVMIGVLALFFLPLPLLMGGVIIGIASVLHLGLSAWKRLKHYPKEPMIALLYTAGIWYGPVIRNGFQVFNSTKIFALILFFVAALLNLLVFSYMDRFTDFADEHPSLVPVVGERAFRFLILVISLAGFVFLQLFITHHPELYISATFLFLLILYAPIALAFEQAMQKEDLYRKIGDGLFLLGFAPQIVQWIGI